MATNISNIELGVSNVKNYSTTTSSSYTDLYNPYQREIYNASGRGSNIDLGHEKATYERTSLCAEPFQGLPEKEENVNKANNSKTYVELGIDESNYHTSNLCGANYMPETPIISHHRKHLYDVYKTKKDLPEIETNEVDMYRDDVNFGDAKTSWDTESSSQFIKFENSNQKINRVEPKTQWSLGHSKNKYSTTMSNSYITMNKDGLNLRAPSTNQGNGSDIFMGTDKISYETSSIFSKQYKPLTE